MKLIIETFKYFLLDFFFQKQKIQIINAIHIIDKILFNIKSPHQLLTSITFGRYVSGIMPVIKYINCYLDSMLSRNHGHFPYRFDHCH